MSNTAEKIIMGSPSMETLNMCRCRKNSQFSTIIMVALC